VNSGGTLLLAQSGGTSSTHRINDSATMTLAGGTFNTGGLSERSGTLAAPTAGIGALTLTATSTINFGSGNTSIIEFSALGTHTLGTILQITNWDGTPVTGGGTERLLFAGLATSFTTTYVQTEVSFLQEVFKRFGSGTNKKWPFRRTATFISMFVWKRRVLDSAFDEAPN
jgi:hypothetical protein